jgi:hypothetical protein
MRCSSTRLLALGTFVLATNAVAPTLFAHPEPRGIWAMGGGTLVQEVHPLSRGAVAPDGRSAVRATAQGLVVSTAAGARLLPLHYTPGLAEVVWSPGSRYVAINASNGGAIGSWDTYVLAASDASHAVPVRQLVEAKLGSRWGCKGREIINIGTVGWERGSEELLVVAEVPPRPYCEDGGAIQGVRIHLGRREVTRVLTAQSVRTDWWPQLGSRFRSLQ